MKRLIRKAEVFTTIDYAASNGNSCNVYKNPSMEELKSVKAESNNNSIKGIINIDNNVYIWAGQIPNDIVSQTLGVIMNGMDIQCSNSDFSIDAKNKFTFEDVQNKLNNIKSIISNTFGVSSIQILNSTDKEGTETINL